MGCEVDFTNQRKTGVDYFVPTREGQTYYLRDLGKNYGDPAGAFVPADVYGKFNVDILVAYITGKEAAEKAKPGSGADYRMPVAELREIAARSSIHLGENGEMFYQPPVRAK